MRSEICGIRDKRGVIVASQVWAAVCRYWRFGPSAWDAFLGLDSKLSMFGNQTNPERSVPGLKWFGSGWHVNFEAKVARERMFMSTHKRLKRR